MANERTMARLCARIQERAAHCLQFELNDPRATFITITRVEITSDLSLATLHWSVLGDEAERTKAQHLLEHASGFIQRQVGSVLSMRRIPRLRWQRDDSLEQAASLDALIKEARQRDRAINPSADGGDVPPAAG
ncbi:MAG: ribosome-binding factor RbfA [Planctomycetota bacterium]|jgi:ribosome-binding factor A